MFFCSLKFFWKLQKKKQGIPYSWITRLELPCDIDKHLFKAKGIRPVIAYTSHIYTCVAIVNINDYSENEKKLIL